MTALQWENQVNLASSMKGDYPYTYRHRTQGTTGEGSNTAIIRAMFPRSSEKHSKNPDKTSEGMIIKLDGTRIPMERPMRKRIISTRTMRNAGTWVLENNANLQRPPPKKNR